MGRKCSVCGHPDRSRIDELLVSGCSFRDISDRFDLTISSLHRHKRNAHLVRVELPALADPQEVSKLDASSLEDQIRTLIGKCLQILEGAEGLQNHRLCLGAIREARQCLELGGKLVGALPGSKEPERDRRPLMIFPPGSSPSFHVHPISREQYTLDRQSRESKQQPTVDVEIEEEGKA